MVHYGYEPKVTHGCLHVIIVYLFYNGPIIVFSGESKSRGRNVTLT